MIMRAPNPFPSRTGTVIQGRFIGRGAAQPKAPGQGPVSSLNGFRPVGAGRPLPGAVRERMEGFFKADFSDVRVHVGPEAASIGALAFTTGSSIYFGPGQYNTDSQQGLALLGHELAHVVQQRQGRVRHPSGQGVAIVQDPLLEAEADRLGQRAANHRVPVVQAKADPARGAVPTAIPVAVPRGPGRLGNPGRGVVQRALVLNQQSGPSCWLAAGTALVGARGHNRAALDALISLYPRDASGMDRAVIMQMIVDALGSAIARLNAFRFNGNLRVTIDQVREFVRRGFRTQNQSVDGAHFFNTYFHGQDFAVMAAVGVLATARDRAEAFLEEMQEHGSATTDIYGYPGVEFGEGNSIADLRTLLDYSQGHASASMSVTGRYLPARNQPLVNGGYDLTGQPLHRGGAHVIVLTDVDVARDRITYRDPNFGNDDMIITFAQFEAMRVANDGAIRLNSVSGASSLVRVATGGLAIPTIQPKIAPYRRR